VLAQRAYEHFGDARYERLAQISVSHLYNLRASEPYQSRRMVWTKTRPSPVAIGMRRAPAPEGLPGYIRIDTVHFAVRGRGARRTRGAKLLQSLGGPDRPMHLIMDRAYEGDETRPLAAQGISPHLFAL
jgi:hypothetical protein